MSTEFVVGAFVCALAAAVAWDWWRSGDGAAAPEPGVQPPHPPGQAASGASDGDGPAGGGDGCGDAGASDGSC